MTDEHDSSDLAGISTRERVPFGSRRFANLVQSRVVRRVSLRRLAIAGVLGGSLLGSLGFISHQCARVVVDWVSDQPEHQIPFAEVELIPPPPAYIEAGARGILDNVLADAHRKPSLSVLGADLEALRIDFSRNPWIARAGSICASYRHLSVTVVYRKPLALMIDETETQGAVIDQNGVELPIRSTHLLRSATSQRWRVIGDTDDLYEVRGFKRRLPDQVGLTWKSIDPNIDQSQVLQVGQLAQFVYDHRLSKTPQGLPSPNFLDIYFVNESIKGPDGRIQVAKGFFLVAPKSICVWWGSGPGAEVQDEPVAAVKWATLLNFMDSNGGIGVKPNVREFLSLISREPTLISVP